MANQPIRQLGENRLVARFRALAAGALGAEVVVGPGDDAAVLRVGRKHVCCPTGEHLLLLACDMMVEGIHFRRDWARPRQIGWKAMVQNISDIAAMGGTPAWAVASVAAPGEAPEELATGLAQGLVEAAAQHGASLVGGDLVGSTGPVVVDVAITGWVARERLLPRAGAAPGDVVLVTGALGAAAAGLAALEAGLREASDPHLAAALKAHLEPIPRLKEAQAIATSGLATAMMDLSDGLADDLPRLCRESKVGARLRAAALPVSPACAAVAERLGKDAVSLAVAGGEDYELLLTCRPEAVTQLQSAVMAATGTPLTPVGEIAADGELLLVGVNGREQPLGRGFDHFAIRPAPDR